MRQWVRLLLNQFYFEPSAHDGSNHAADDEEKTSWRPLTGKTGTHLFCRKYNLWLSALNP
jgi:hypothetical protein